MHAVLAGEFPTVEGNRVFAGNAPAGVARVGFQQCDGQAALGEVEGGGDPGQPAADDDHVSGVVFRLGHAVTVSPQCSFA